MAQITHLLLNPPITSRQKLLKFCYFMMALVLLGCADTKKSDQNDTESIIEETVELEETNGTKTILCFGDSITAGYGLEDTNDAYPALLQDKINAKNLDYTVINSGLSGETTAGGRSRIDWVLRQEVDVFLLELGGNDGLRGISLSETKSNLQAIINSVRSKDASTKIILAGMELPPNMGQDYTTAFRNVFREVAVANDLSFIPFILKDVGGIAELNQSDGIHPTKEGHKIVAKTVWDVLEPLL